MRLLDLWWTSLVYVFDFATFSTWSEQHTHQASLEVTPAVNGAADVPVFHPHVSPADVTDHVESGTDRPIFTPPYPPELPIPHPEDRIKCNYSAMGDIWRACNKHDKRGCWLQGPEGKEFNITTDYENLYPNGTTRKYVLDVTEKALAPDGVPMAHGKVFNNSYPGPWIQACWGDDLEITVRNHLRFNGTTIHWHGIRQLNNVENDGVNGVTQCPIAPGQEFTYKFKAMQYGSSWYHSHYSLQYADGMVGPITIYGPSSDNYDYAEEPILMTDWNHRSAFEDWSYSLQPGHNRPLMTNILLNGQGRYIKPKTNKPVVETQRYTKILEKGKRYLLRLINTSVDTTFIFAIDGHNLTVVGADFVPITPYNTSSVLVGIGQRYHVVLIADPINPAEDDNYWVRTVPAVGCGKESFPADAQLLNNTGIIRYADSAKDPTSTWNSTIPTKCSDEPYESLKPILTWNVTKPSNPDVENNNRYDVGLQPVHGHPYHPNYDRPLWSVDNLPLWLDFGEPTILNLNTENGSWSKHLDVVTHNHKKESDWVYLVVTAPIDDTHNGKDRKRLFFPVAHPIHLHGHDFAILKQSTSPYPGWEKVKNELHTNNPPRRDVALLPEDGYLVIAFKADNPGTWLLHCHIAWHASSGLAMQILENTDNLAKRLSGGGKLPNKQIGIIDTCNAWSDWVEDFRNHYDPHHPNAFQDDSGI